MKKVLVGLVVLIVIVAVGGYAWYKSAYGGTDYYVKITTDGKKFQQTDDNGKKYDMWEYNLSGFDAEAKEKKLDFNADHDLLKDAYLKVTYNDKKGVTTWEEVEQDKIPKKAQDKLK